MGERGFRRIRGALGSIAVALMVVAVVPAAHSSAQVSGQPIEERYAATGPHAVATESVTQRGRVRFEIFYPADIGDDGLQRPVVVWGNGSDATPADYEALLRHLASWGLVVVAATTTGAGDGTEILAAARYAVAAHDDPDSSLGGHLDVAAIGAAGHSQGAGGSMRASANSDGLIATTVAISLPARIWVSPGDEFAPADLTGPVLFLSGATDIVISGPSANRRYFNEAPEPAAMAMRRGAGHLEPQGDGDGFRGYLTAWLLYQLAGDVDAATAFVGGTSEFLTNPRWSHQAAKGLALPDLPDPAATITVPSTAAPQGLDDVPAPPSLEAGRLPATGWAASPIRDTLTTFALTAGAVAAAMAAHLGRHPKARRSASSHTVMSPEGS